MQPPRLYRLTVGIARSPKNSFVCKISKTTAPNTCRVKPPSKTTTALKVYWLHAAWIAGPLHVDFSLSPKLTTNRVA